MPLERRRVVPAEGVDIEGRSRIGLERLGGAERTDRRRQVVMPWAGVGVVFLIVEGVIGAQFQPRFGAEQGDAVDLAARSGDMFLVTPAQPAEEIQLPLARVVVPGGIVAGQRV